MLQMPYNKNHFEARNCYTRIESPETYLCYEIPPLRVALQRRVVEANLTVEVLGDQQTESLFRRGAIVPCRFLVKRGRYDLVKKGYVFGENAESVFRAVLLQRTAAQDYTQLL